MGRITRYVKSLFSAEPEEIRNYRWDSKLQFSCEKFWKVFYNDGYDSEAAKKIPFPSDSELAQFANLAYQLQYEECKLPDDWVLLTKAYNKYTDADAKIQTSSASKGYFGVAFWNSRLRQVIVAHKGTEIENSDDRSSDIDIFFNKERTKQSESAATFVHHISNSIKDATEKQIYIQLSITGHSLGGWFAQITTFTVKYFKTDKVLFIEDEKYVENIHAHTVVFDSPGCKLALKKIRNIFVPPYKNRKYGNYHSLDITVYLNDPSWINTLHKHVGTLYLTESKKHTIIDVISHFDEEGKINKEIVLDFPYGKVVAAKLFIKRAHDLFPSNKPIPTEPYDPNQCSLNVFNEAELNFIHHWKSALKNFDMEPLKREYSVPTFEIDIDNHVIMNVNENDVFETIAKIKRLRPTSDHIFHGLSVNQQNTVLYDQLIQDTHNYRRNLLSFGNYFFEDSKYRLKDFIQSKNCHVLHICVDQQTDIKLEMSILSNIIHSYQKTEPIRSSSYFDSGRCAFVNDCDKLNEMLLRNIHTKHALNLLIIEGNEEKCVSTILSYKSSQVEDMTKVIVISVEPLGNEKLKGNIQEVVGYGSNIIFEDLNKHSQDQLKERTKVKFNEVKYSFSTIIKRKPLPSNDALLELLQLPDEEIIGYRNTASLNNACFTDFFYKIDPTKNKIKHEENIQYIIEDQTKTGFDFSRIFDKECTHVKIGRKMNFELECNKLPEEKEIAYLIKVNNNEDMFIEKMFNRKFYTHRDTYCEICTSHSIFKCEGNMIYFCGNEEVFKENIKSLDATQQQFLKFVSKENNAKEIVKNHQASAHLFKIVNNKIVWLYSNKEINSIRKYICLNKAFRSEIPEKKLMMNYDVIILNARTGMGKTSVIKYLHEYYNKKNQWVFTISLRHSAFDELPEEVDFNAALKFILTSCNTLASSFFKYLLTYCLQKKTALRVYLFFDGFDEIYEEHIRQKLITLFNFLRQNSTAKMIITTRNLRCEELENGLAVFSSEFTMYDSNREGKTYILKIWDTQQYLFEKGMRRQQLEKFLTNVLKHVNRRLGETDYLAEGNPLHIRMIAEVLAPHMHYQESIDADQVKITTILELYRKFIQIHYDIYVNKTDLKVNEVQRRWWQKSISERLHELAMARLPTADLTTAHNFNEECADVDEEFEENELKELYKTGLIQPQLNNDIDFFHDSLHSYFVANTLKQWLESHSESSFNVATFIVSSLLTDVKYKEMRRFLNYQLEKPKIPMHRLNQCQATLEQLGESALYNDSMETIFHICVRENLYFLTKNFLFKIIKKDTKINLLSVYNSISETSVRLAIHDIYGYYTQNQLDESMLSLFIDEFRESKSDAKKILFATLCNYFVNERQLEILNNCFAKNVDLQEVLTIQYEQIQKYISACETNCIEDLRNVLQNLEDGEKACLLSMKDNLGKVGLHRVTCVEALKLLLQHGANISLKDNRGMTPLNRAVKEGRNEIAEILIQNHADIDICDNMGYVPLMHAAKRNNLDIIKLLINSSDSLNINKSNRFGVTALMLAANYGHSEVVEFLLQNRADHTISDENEWTVLEHAKFGRNPKAVVQILKKKFNYK